MTFSQMTTRAIGVLLAAALAWQVSSCKKTHQGAFEAGNPGLRTVQGTVPQSNDACLADQAVATDSDFVQTKAFVNASCAFALSLPVDKSYSIVFLLDDVLVAQVSFDGSDFFFLEEGDGPVDLGLISFGDPTDGDVTAAPEVQPPESGGDIVEPVVSSLFGIYRPGTVSGLTCPEIGDLLLPQSVFDVFSDGDDGLIVTQTVPSDALDGFTEIVMPGDFVSPGYFSVSGTIPDLLQLVACEGPIGQSSGQWHLSATCNIALSLIPDISLGVCTYSNFIKDP